MRLVGEDFSRLFETFDRDAFRLETCRHYVVDEERDALRQFLAGEPYDLGWFEPWLAGIRSLTSSGRTMRRVRVMDEPPTDYQRFELAVTPTNLEAGEDIRVLTRSTAATLGLPDYDFWLFDDARLAIMQFTDDGFFLGAELVPAASAVAAHIDARERAIATAISYQQYMTQSPIDPASR